jgi:hypothetical protein
MYGILILVRGYCGLGVEVFFVFLFGINQELADRPATKKMKINQSQQPS